MHGETTDRDDILQAGGKPDVNRIIGLYKNAKNDLSDAAAYYRRMQDVRYCQWAGMSPDGRKHADKNGKVFPWDGASDLRTFVVDDIIESLAASAMRSLFKARITAIPRTGGDYEMAGRISQFAEWYFKSAIPEARRETELWLQWGLTHGKSVMGVFWERREGFVDESVEVGEVAAASADVATYINDEMNGSPSEGAIADVMEFYDVPTRAKAEMFLAQLKTVGVATRRVKRVVSDRVRLRAFRVGVDFFCPKNVDDLESAPYVFVREWLSPADLRARADAAGWNKAFTEEALNAKGEYDDIPDSASIVSANKPDYRRVEICTAYYKARGADGTVGLYYCVFAPSVGDLYAEAGEYDVEPQRFPFVAYTRENVERELFDSRGVAEIAEGGQREIKTQKDARIDRTSIEINPPKLYRAGRKPTEYRPGVWIPVSGADFKIMEEFRSSGNAAASENVEGQLKAELMARFGCSDGDTANSEISIKKQKFIDGFFAACSRVLEQVYFLYRAFGADRTLFTPIDEPDGSFVEINRDLAYGDFAFTIVFDVQDENFDLFLKKFDVAAKFIGAFDRTGSVNTSRLLKRLLSRMFPDEVKYLVATEEDSYRREVLETQGDLAAIYSAQPVNAPEHCNAQLRLQLVQQYAQTPSVAARLAQDADFANALQNYAKQLQFQMQQDRNAVIGRIGAEPASGLASDSGLMGADMEGAR